MDDVYVEKLVSLNPDIYNHVRQSYALKQYYIYIENWVKTMRMLGKYEESPKSFREWCNTEI